MRKVMILSMIPIFVFLLPLGMIGGSFFLTGCVEEPAQRFKETPPAILDNMFSYSRFPYYNQLFGYPNSNDWLRMWKYLSNVGTAALTEGYLVDDDHKSFAIFFRILHEGMAGARKEYEIALEQKENTSCALMLDDQIDILETASYTGMGDFVNQLFYQLGRDWLYHHLFPILERYWTMPDDTYTDFINSVEEIDNLTKLSEPEFEELIEILERMLDDKDATYGPIWDAFPSVWEMIGRIKNYGNNVDVDDGKNFVDSLLNIAQDLADEGIDIEIDGDDKLFEKLGEALDRVWDDGKILLKQELDGDGNLVDLPEENWVTLTFQGELKKLLNFVGILMSNQLPWDSHDEDNGWYNKGPMTDLARVLLSLQKLLDDDILPRARFRDFLDAFLAASAAMDKTSAMGDGADSINGILGTYYNPVYFASLDYAVDYLFKHNQDNQLRSDGGEEIDVLRVLLFLLPVMDNPSLGGLLGTAMVFTPPGVVNRANMMDFVAGEAATASMNHDDPFDYLDYLFYRKPYNVAFFMNFNGFFDLLSTFRPLIDFLVLFTPPGNMVDDLEAALDSAYVAVAQGTVGSPPVTQAGVYHQLLFFMQVIEHFYFMPYPGRATWDSGLHGWERELVDLVVSLNETVSSRVFANDNGANGFLKTVGGAHGYGLATYVLRNHSDPSRDGVFLDSILYMLSMIVNELIDTDYDDPNYNYYAGTKYEGTLWAALMDYIKDHKFLGIDIDEDYDQWVSSAFDPDENGDILLDTVEKLLPNFHDIIVIFMQDIGKVILAVTEDDMRYNQIMDDIEKIGEIIDKLNYDTDADGSGSPADFFKYLIEENKDGSDNKFVANLKVIFIKFFDLKPGSESEIARRHSLQDLDRVSDEYKYYLNLYKNIDEGAAWWFKEANRELAFFDDNYVLKEGQPRDFEGSIDDDATLSDLFKHLFGEDDDMEGGVYSLSYVKDFVDELLVSNVNLFGALEDALNETIVEHHAENSERAWWGGIFTQLKTLLWEYWFPKKFFRYEGFQPLDYDLDGKPDPPGVYLLCRLLDLETDFNGFLEDSLLFWGGPDMAPGGTTWIVWEEVFRNQEDAMWLWEDEE